MRDPSPAKKSVEATPFWRRPLFWRVIGIGAACMLITVLVWLSHPQSGSSDSPAMANGTATQGPVETTGRTDRAASAALDASRRREAQDAATISVGSLTRLLDRAKSIVADNGGNADQVFSQAVEHRNLASSALGSGSWTEAQRLSRLADEETKTAVHAFLDDLIRKYALIAHKKMNENELDVAKIAIEKAKELQRLKARFQRETEPL